MNTWEIFFISLGKGHREQHLSYTESIMFAVRFCGNGKSVCDRYQEITNLRRKERLIVIGVQFVAKLPDVNLFLHNGNTLKKRRALNTLIASKKPVLVDISL